MPNKILSILSNTPPCPGKNVPVSLTLAFLFKKEKNKSPIWQLIETIADKTKIKYEKLFV